MIFKHDSQCGKVLSKGLISSYLLLLTQILLTDFNYSLIVISVTDNKTGRLECIYFTIFSHFFQLQTVVAVLNKVIISCFIKNITIIWTFEILSYIFVTAPSELFLGSVFQFQTSSHSPRYTLAHLQKQRAVRNGRLTHQTSWPFITAWCFNRRHALCLLPSTKLCVIDTDSDLSKMPKRFGAQRWSPLKIQVAFTYRCFPVPELAVLL